MKLTKFHIKLGKLVIGLLMVPVLCLLVGGPAWGTSYYIDTASTGGDGTTQLTSGATAAFATLAAAQAKAGGYAAGDSLLLKCGGTWREQLTFPSSGSVGSPIVIGSYGVGAKPKILGSLELSSPAQWTQPTASGTVTPANLRLSIVNGSAFVDFSSAASLIPYLGAKLVITDSAGKKLTGYIKEAGTGETLDSEIWSNNSFTAWTGDTPDGWSVTGESGSNPAIHQVGSGEDNTGVGTGSANIYTTTAIIQMDSGASLTSGGLYKCSLTISYNSGSGVAFEIGGQYTSALNITSTGSRYRIAQSASQAGLKRPGGATNTTIDDASLKRVLTPSATGVTIVSTAGGSTYNWASEESGFDRVYAGNYTYAIDTSPMYYATATLDVGNLIFNSEASVGVKKSTMTLLAAQGDFYWDDASDRVYLYSSSNPGSYYTAIEAALDRIGIEIYEKSHITILGIEFKYQGRSGIYWYSSGGSAANNITIDGCDLSFIGGSYHPSTTTRNGNAVTCWSNSSDVLVQNCRIDQVYDAGISPQTTTAGAVFANHIYRNNIVTNCEYGFEVFVRGAGSTFRGLVVANNIFYGNGSGWGHSQRPEPTGYGIRNALNEVGSFSDTLFINNIIDQSTAAHFYALAATDLQGWSVDFNDYYPNTGTLFSFGGTAYNFDDWKTQTECDADSIASDPLFVNAAGGDFHLQEGSPCILGGAGLAVLHGQTAPATDYAGIPVLWGPAIGAYQYSQQPPANFVPSSAQLLRSTATYPVTLNLSGDLSAQTFDLSNPSNSGTITVTGAFKLLKLIGNTNVNIVGSNARITGPLELGDNAKMHGFTFVHE